MIRTLARGCMLMLAGPRVSTPCAAITLRPLVAGCPTTPGPVRQHDDNAMHAAVKAKLTAITRPLRHPMNGRYFIDGSGKAVTLTGSHHWNNFQDGDSVFDYDAYLDVMVQHH